ncbi:hypothetical protein [uncultured Nitratireductor sp.]|uniref:hypothetical protein n=1 Tax=uncultured Nitratireductor sp. TaxID=520953 RepID=UPI0025F0275D|nr:hypothetical protein [uncultured Nitratireductor sp.]
MREAETIARLRELRQLRAQRARETVVRRHAAMVGAEKALRDASVAKTLHLQKAASEEKAQLASLVGQQVDVDRIHQLQGFFHQRADELAQLLDIESSASAAARRHEEKLAAARVEHRVCARAVSKLDLVLEKLSSNSVYGKVVREESGEDEPAEHGAFKKT